MNGVFALRAKQTSRLGTHLDAPDYTCSVAVTAIEKSRHMFHVSRPVRARVILFDASYGALAVSGGLTK